MIALEALGSPATGLLAPAATRIAVALGGGLVGVTGAFAARTRRRTSDDGVGRLTDDTLFVRWRTWAVIAPVWLLAVVHPLGTVALVVALSVVAVVEFSRLVDLPRSQRVVLLSVALLAGPLAALDLSSWRALPPLLLLAATLPPLLAQDVEDGARHLAFGALGATYLPYLLSYLWLLRAHTAGGPGVLLLVGVAVAASDVGAFVVGSALGRRSPRLARRLSPNKTVAGVFGNVGGAALATVAFAPLTSLPAGWLLLGLPVVVGLGAVWGDLLTSLLKRTAGVKDAGDWLPGFGGLLDRIDSLLVVAPLTYTWLTVGAHLAGGGA